MRLKLTIAYDGGSFAGWQSQNHRGAVQDVLEAALARIAGAPIRMHGAGRTDAGVHALGQCAHADVPEGRLAPADWQRALNAHLPPAVRVMRAQRAAADFHARFSARGKIYRYTMRLSPVLPPLEAGRVWHVARALDLAALREAAAFFAGRHDFSAFAANRGTEVADTVRTIRRAEVRQAGSLVTVTFEGDGFLYKMVRMMIGAAVKTAAGQEPLEGLRSRLATGAPKWTHVAPAAGLCLVRVLY